MLDDRQHPGDIPAGDPDADHVVDLAGHRLVREDPDPKLSPALDEAGNGHTGRLDLSVGDPADFGGLDAVFTERQRGAAGGLAAHASALLFTMLYPGWQQHAGFLSL